MFRAALFFLFFACFALNVGQSNSANSLSSKPVDTNMAPIPSFSSKIRAHVFRLRPGQDFVEELTVWAKAKKIKAGAILSVVGSFKQINLRYANEPSGTTQSGYFEIVSLVGTFNDTSRHLHVSVSNNQGQTFGGHMLPGNIVYTTAEVVVAELDDLTFSREKDEESQGGSGWEELVIKTNLISQE